MAQITILPAQRLHDLWASLKEDERRNFVASLDPEARRALIDFDPEATDAELDPVDANILKAARVRSSKPSALKAGR